MKKFALFLLSAVMVLTSCSPKVQYVTTEKVRIDSVYRYVTRVDSIFERDSTYRHDYERNDTIFSEKIVYKWRDRKKERSDTIYESKTDSIPVPYPVHVEVEKDLSYWEKLRMNIGDITILIVVIIAIVTIIKKTRK